MNDISFFDMIPDVETYHELRASVDWVVFCREQSEKASMLSRVSKSCPTRTQVRL